MTYYKHKEADKSIQLPECVSRATEDYFRDNDPFHTFFEDYFANEGLFEAKNEISKKELYSAYKDFADESGARKFSEKSLSRKLKTEHGLEDKFLWIDGKATRGFVGMDKLRAKFKRKSNEEEKT